jgi:hypothetical protein
MHGDLFLSLIHHGRDSLEYFQPKVQLGFAQIGNQFVRPFPGGIRDGAAFFHKGKKLIQVL